MKKCDFVSLYGGERMVEILLEDGGAHIITTVVRFYYNIHTRRDWMKYQNAGKSTMRYRVSRVSQNGIEPASLERNKERVKQGLAYLLEANAKRNK